MSITRNKYWNCGFFQKHKKCSYLRNFKHKINGLNWALAYFIGAEEVRTSSLTSHHWPKLWKWKHFLYFWRKLFGKIRIMVFETAYKYLTIILIIHWETNSIESIAFLSKACILLIQKNMPIKLLHMLPILQHIDLNQWYTSF